MELDGQLFTIVDWQHIKMGRGGAIVRIKLRNLRTGANLERTFDAGERFQRAFLEHRPVQYSYNDGDTYYFMDTSTFEQVHISEEALGDSKYYLIPDSVIRVEFYESEPVGIELPQTVDLVVKETVPGIKGATASAQVKPATLETGLVVQVPPFINEGDRVRVNTETGEYQSRA